MFKVPPKIIFDVPAILRVLPGSKLWCSAKGTPPIYTALIWDSTVLVNTTKYASVKLDKEGNYTCVATSKYGADIKALSVFFTGKYHIYYIGRIYTVSSRYIFVSYYYMVFFGRIQGL